MISRILRWLFIAIIFLIIFVWIIGGGISRGLKAANGSSGPLDFLGAFGAVHLPWQPAQPLDLPDNLIASTSDATTFGYPSPSSGIVSFVSQDAAESDPNLEYIELQVGDMPVSLDGWSLQSAYSGVRALVPPDSESLVSGAVNALTHPEIPANSVVYIISGKSPVGVSFRENKCTGYLGQFQQFAPPLDQSCPSPADTLAITGDNLRSYSAECIDYVQTLAPCHFPTDGELPLTLPQACRTYITNTFSYNGCAAAHGSDPDYQKDSWRLFLNSPTELWNNSHDVIRLLDDKGQIVDVLTY
jgi:hypothetical protein